MPVSIVVFALFSEILCHMKWNKAMVVEYDKIRARVVKYTSEIRIKQAAEKRAARKQEPAQKREKSKEAHKRTAEQEEHVEEKSKRSRTEPYFSISSPDSNSSS